MRQRDLDARDMSASFKSDWIPVLACKGFAIQFVYTGAPVGQVKIVASNDKITEDDLPDSIAAINAAGHHTYNSQGQINYAWVRIVYTATSGAGGMTAISSGQEVKN